jgi:hypothetical protein
MEWLLRIARDQGAPVAACEEQVREAARSFDAAAGDIVLSHFASAVWIEISKPD